MKKESNSLLRRIKQTLGGISVLSNGEVECAQALLCFLPPLMHQAVDNRNPGQKRTMCILLTRRWSTQLEETNEWSVLVRLEVIADLSLNSRTVELGNPDRWRWSRWLFRGTGTIINHQT